MCKVVSTAGHRHFAQKAWPKIEMRSPSSRYKLSKKTFYGIFSHDTSSATIYVNLVPLFQPAKLSSMEKIIQSLLLVVALAFSIDGHYHHIHYLKKDHSDDAETVPDRPGFTGEWEINGTTPWAFPENEIANQRNLVESSGGRCAFRSQSQNDEKVFEEAFNRWKAAIKNGKNTGWFNGRRLKTFVIPTYVHVLTDGKKGDVSEQMIDDQIQVLNDAFEEAGFHFLLMKQNGMGASRTSNKKWHQGMYV